MFGFHITFRECTNFKMVREYIIQDVMEGRFGGMMINPPTSYNIKTLSLSRWDISKLPGQGLPTYDSVNCSDANIERTSVKVSNNNNNNNNNNNHSGPRFSIYGLASTPDER